MKMLKALSLSLIICSITAAGIRAETFAEGPLIRHDFIVNELTHIDLKTTTTTTTTETTTETTTIQIFDTSALSNQKQSWYYVPNDKHGVPRGNESVKLNKYSAYYTGNTAEKVIYLTFDEGYENGYTPKILDILKAKDVKAAFFVTKPYIESNPELIKRMTAEGHIVGNHSAKHLSSPSLTESQLQYELNSTAEAYKAVTSMDMPKFFRPPMCEYSERTLAVVHNMGYKSIFWSFAHKDWLTDQQPGAEVAYNTVMQRYHNGEIMLLHAVSSSNTEALGRIIDSLRAQGYSFKTLDEL